MRGPLSYWFTVIGYYEDSGQCLTHSLRARSPRYAIRKAIRELGASPDNVMIVEVLSGRHSSESLWATVTSGSLA